jgi:hypothetical protein
MALSYANTGVTDPGYSGHIQSLFLQPNAWLFACKSSV